MRRPRVRIVEEAEGRRHQLRLGGDARTDQGLHIELLVWYVY